MFNLLAHAGHGGPLEVVLHALLDSAKLLPILVLVHILMAVIDKYAGKKTYSLLKGPLSPLIGTAAGSLPQCGFSVAATRLYTKKYIPLGALIAVYVATSDEAIVILLGSPEGAKKLLPLLIIKFILALLAGYFINFVLYLLEKRKFQSPKKDSAQPLQKDTDHHHHDEQDIVSSAHNSSCGCGCHGKENKLKTFLIHPIIHSLQIFAFILVVNLVMGFIIFFVTEHRVESFMLGMGYFQPIVAAVVGLIPNCAASVIIAQMYAENLLSLGSAVAGLSVGAGLGYAVLIKENKNKLTTMFILLGMFTFGAVAGIITDLILT